jgi:DNA-binding protein YbaB
MRARVEVMLDEYAGLAARLDRMQSDVAAVTGSAQSVDGRIAATVNQSGELVRLSLDDTLLRRMEARTFAAQIVEVVGLAAAAARRRVSQIVAQALPGQFDGAMRSDGSLDVARLVPPVSAGRAGGDA